MRAPTKMSSVFVLFLLIAAVNASRKCDVNAPLPKLDSPIDFNEYKGVWYESLTTMDPAAMAHACIVGVNITNTADPPGFETVEVVYYENGRTVTMDTRATRLANGYYKQQIVQKSQEIAYESDENGKANPEAASAYKELEYDEYSFVGDPDHYLAYVNCISSGWLVWVSTKGKTVTPELFIYIQNDLLEYGISVPLRLAHCEIVPDK